MTTEHTAHVWSGADLADALVRGLGSLEADTAREQAVSGIDGLDEVDLHPHVAHAIQAAGFGVHREVRYPGSTWWPQQSQGATMRSCTHARWAATARSTHRGNTF